MSVMRTIMWSKWGYNLLLVGVLGLVILMIYWQNKLLTLQEEQQLLRDRLDRIAAIGSQQNGLADAYSQSDGAQSVQDSAVIIYNRIPKTGSTSLMGIAYELCTKNGFHVIHLNTTKNSHVLSPDDQLRFAQNITSWTEKRPAIYHGHLGYIDFATVGVPLRPLYINVVRDPLDRLVSYYYFLRNGDNFRPEVNRRRKGNNETFDECVARKGMDCDPVNLWMQIPFFCGHHSLCWEPGSSWALQQAKSNLANSYLLVGITESLDSFVALLESALPRFFNGASDIFKQGGKSHLRITYGKKPPSEETIKAFKKSKIYDMEHNFYLFAKRNFMSIKKKALLPNNIPVTQQFRFEKIRPK